MLVVLHFALSAMFFTLPALNVFLFVLLVWLPALAPASLSGSGRQPGTGSHSGWLHAVSTCFGSSALSSFICCLQDGA